MFAEEQKTVVEREVQWFLLERGMGVNGAHEETWKAPRASINRGWTVIREKRGHIWWCRFLKEE